MEKLNLLIIENDLNDSSNLLNTLKKFGLKNIYIARNIQSAFILAASTKIDLLISDVKIHEETDGIDAVKTLQNLYRLPVIFISSSKDKKILHKVSQINAMIYVLKPYDTDVLETLLNLTIIKFNLLGNLHKSLKVNDYTYEKEDKNLYFKQSKIQLTKKEKLFMALVFNNINSFVSYEVIDRTVWYESLVMDNTRRTFFYRLKNKLNNIGFKIEKNVGIGLFT